MSSRTFAQNIATAAEPPCASALLREVTRAEHGRAEAAVLGRLALDSRASYRDYLERLAGFYAPMEDVVYGSRAFLSHVPSASERRKLPGLVADLRFLGGESRAFDRCQALPRLDTSESLLGGAYVLEGATLGGKILLERLRFAPAVAPGLGATFFTGYGARTGAMWRDFRSALDASVHSEAQHAELVRGAVETFTAFERWVEPR